MHKTILYAFAFATISLSSAHASPCSQHYQSSGVPLVTAVTYKTWMEFPSVNPTVAFDKVSRAVLAEGFVDVNAEKQLGTLTAQQETTGSGRPQTLRVVVRKSGKGSRVDALFMVPQGQVAPSMSDNLCRVVNSVAD
ncbi:hypothetical protein ACXHXG_13270 [Rhizobium sp. LEGMi198b]|uniref:hypothetical protein n=1 Tax=unclassified Rhizobium TaxID=2613769 RepID=UPI0021A8C093|nr:MULTISPECIES: hypothetical protein [Rhizobium]MDK4740459.1 hypothetical protein [Rhizobium sp. CNPSo 3464]UWU24530.1 hypothetical protein N2601_20460 [Rhizobium tropici]WFU05505.1 hypothetical protein QA648_20170 [Rhizobium sp. CB3171]